MWKCENKENELVFRLSSTYPVFPKFITLPQLRNSREKEPFYEAAAAAEKRILKNS